jgi:beta-N-acetylhexosaminidase
MAPWQKKPLCIMLCISFFLLLSGPLHADRIDDRIARMTLPQKIGQILMIGIEGHAIDSREASRLGKISPGGLVLFSRNFREPEDIPRLIAQMRPVSSDSGLPMFFAIDQEGGIVHRIGGELYMPPSAPAIGSTGSEKTAHDVGLAVGIALRELGINVNLAPVLDVPSDVPSSPMTFRSFSDDPEEVATLGASYIRGLREAGVLATAKHFPNLGRALTDSHFVLPLMKWGSREERDRDIMPYRRAIGAGVDFIMTGHVIAEPGDGIDPVSLSSYWLRDVLRTEMGFRGLVIVDNLEMKAIEGSTAVPEAAVRSFNAGADIIMVSHEPKNQEKVFRALLDAARRGIIPGKRLDESLRRIIDAKMKIAADTPQGIDAAALRDISRKVAEKYVTALKMRDVTFVPVRDGDKVLFAGNNLTLYNVVKDAFGPVEILNAPLQQFDSMNRDASVAALVSRFDAVIIDANYPGAPSVIALCDKFAINYFVVQNFLPRIGKTIEQLRPRQIVLANEINAEYYRVALEILQGVRKETGKLPFHLPLPKDYTYLSR